MDPVYSEGTLTVKNCLFYDNDAYSTNNGLIYIDDVDADIINCTFAIIPKNQFMFIHLGQGQ